MGFTFIVFILLWLFQILFMEKFYTISKISDVEAAASLIIESYENDTPVNFSENLGKIAMENDLCIEIVDRYGRSKYTKEYSVDCIIHDKPNSTYAYQLEIEKNGNYPIWRKLQNAHKNYFMVLHGCALGNTDNPDGYLFINTALVPVGSTVKIIKRQLMTVTFLLLIMAFFISLFVSRRIARPIDNITLAAESLAKGNFNTKFDGRGYLEVKQLADALTYAEKELSRVDRLQRDLIANVSHDLRTPLTSIINYVDLLEKEEIENETAKEYIGVLSRQSARLKKLIEDLLEASKASTGNVNVNLTQLELGILLSQALGEYDEKFSKSNLQVVLNKTDDLLLVMADNRHIWRVFDNILNNISKYAQPNTRVYIDAKRNGKMAEISFRNISKDPLNISGDELMERFVRGDSSRNTEGSGLGLSIAKSLTEVQKGKLDIQIDGDLFKVRLAFPLSE
mgnify:CR=1 FL=1